MKKLLLLILLIVFGNISFSQILLDENIDYTAGDQLVNHGWNNPGASATNPILTVTPGLTFSGYPLSGIGNAAGLMTTGQDINKAFSDSVTSGAVYAALMLKVTSAQSAGDYFMHFGIATDNTFIFMGRVFVRLAANGNLSFGITKSSVNVTSAPIKYSDSLYTLNTTYLVVLKYQFGPGTTDDSASLFINPVLTGPEPLPVVSQGLLSSGTDPSALKTFNLRQGSGTAAPELVIDGIRVTKSWSQILPVELTSFTASVVNNGVRLNWSTATELNNKGFEIEKRTGSSSWSSIAFINGKGTTSENQNYAYTDKTSNGKYQYRLKQVDFNGNFEYSKAVEVDFFSSSYSLNQNYPNPFNPSTEISFNVPKSGNVILKVYNLIGQEVKTLVNGMVEAGAHSVKFNAAGLNSGLYFYKLETESFSQVKKMTLMK